ncbi:hypothetical protein AX774_g5187 [Zancudomyces culisetae]|uniref:Uncharacterized protein n=1 Tax=Zancudomyces culisetae TaxID=1213189 RepID=A0A1R1PKE6_ZANCU|nr:hypothetical protein AX774_g5187 [Zancudomyces culisetae]|eukprot:OMH81352.1 hypothetical protein AX774_g5187 [Zancudomyces culisetae]
MPKRDDNFDASHRTGIELNIEVGANGSERQIRGNSQNDIYNLERTNFEADIGCVGNSIQSRGDFQDYQNESNMTQPCCNRNATIHPVIVCFRNTIQVDNDSSSTLPAYDHIYHIININDDDSSTIGSDGDEVTSIPTVGGQIGFPAFMFLISLVIFTFSVGVLCYYIIVLTKG